MGLAFFLSLALAAISGLAHPLQEGVSSEVYARGPRFPGSWYHSDDHFAHTLFRRDDSSGNDPAVGTPAWVASFPKSVADVDQVPQAWSDALAAAVTAGKIPNIPPSILSSSGIPKYQSGFDADGPVVCSATYKCRNPGDLWDAPDGVFALTFDDGPVPTSDPLYDFLSEQSVHATHFMIGVNILYDQKQFNKAFATIKDDIAVHTWTHPYMTTLTDAQIVGELGYTILVIYQLTGGRLPKYWRPPYGDSDNRVRAIAKEVFGLETILWNQDTADWTMSLGRTTLPQVEANLQKWFTGPKSPGLIILEHELTNKTVQAFIDTFPIAKAAGWNMLPLSQVIGDGTAYQNADGDDGPVTSAPIALTATGSTTSSTVSSVNSASHVAAATGKASGAAAASSTATTGAKSSGVKIWPGQRAVVITITALLLDFIAGI